MRRTKIIFTYLFNWFLIDLIASLPYELFFDNLSKFGITTSENSAILQTPELF